MFSFKLELVSHLPKRTLWSSPQSSAQGLKARPVIAQGAARSASPGTTVITYLSACKVDTPPPRLATTTPKGSRAPPSVVLPKLHRSAIFVATTSPKFSAPWERHIQFQTGTCLTPPKAYALVFATSLRPRAESPPCYSPGCSAQRKPWDNRHNVSLGL